MTPLGTRIARQISQTGPITIAEYMATCLMHPTLGYYSTRDPFGTKGDFITAPEISQMFGELIGLCLAQTWLDQGRPPEIALAELGPGRGTLMQDALRATAQVPGFHDAARIHLIETSAALQAVQTECLPQATHHLSVDSLPEMPLYIVANEFFDALPIRQFMRDGNGWRERVVSLAEDKLIFGMTAPAPLEHLAHRLKDTKDGDLIEDCPALAPVITTISQRIAKHGGVALILDYGDWCSQGDTLQAVAKHKTLDPLASPGEADLTAHVDFEAVARNATPLAYSRLTPQGMFLERLGITARAQQLAGGLRGEPLETHIAAHRRLTHPTEMGHLFKAIALYPTQAPIPAGFTP